MIKLKEIPDQDALLQINGSFKKFSNSPNWYLSTNSDGEKDYLSKNDHDEWQKKFIDDKSQLPDKDKLDNQKSTKKKIISLIYMVLLWMRQTIK